MGKMRVFAGLSIVAALLSAGAIYWQRDSGPSATPTESTTLSSGKGKASVDAHRGVSKDLSSGLMSRNLIEPAPGFQGIRPEPREQSVETSKREGPLDKQRTSAELALTPQANETSPARVPDVPLDDGASTDEVLAELPEDAIQADSKAGLAAPSAATLQPDAVAVDERRHSTIASTTPAEADDAAVGEALEEEDAVTARAKDGADAVAEPPPPPPSRQESEAAAPRMSAPEPVAREDDRDHSRQLASKPVGLDDDIKPTEALKAPEASRQGQGSDANEPSSVPFDDIIYAKLLLRLLGHVPGPVDGRTDTKTKDAILAFQRDHGRETTGEIDDELIAVMESMLSETFRRYSGTAPGHGSGTPSVTQAEQSAEKAAKAPPGNRSQRKTTARPPVDLPTKETTPAMPPSEIATLGTQAKQPAVEGAVQEAALPEPSSRLEASSEKAVEKAEGDVVNAFEACAKSGQRDYVKTETGFVLCEGLSFDTRSRQ